MQFLEKCTGAKGPGLDKRQGAKKLTRGLSVQTFFTVSSRTTKSLDAVKENYLGLTCPFTDFSSVREDEHFQDDLPVLSASVS